MRLVSIYIFISNRIPGVIGFGLSFTSELASTENSGLSDSVRITRALAVGVEGLAISLVVVAGASAGCVATTGACPVGAVMAGGAVAIGSQAVANFVNENWVFPWIEKADASYRPMDFSNWCSTSVYGYQVTCSP